jgi:hypothetical protein
MGVRTERKVVGVAAVVVVPTTEMVVRACSMYSSVLLYVAGVLVSVPVVIALISGMSGMVAGIL